MTGLNTTKPSDSEQLVEGEKQCQGADTAPHHLLIAKKLIEEEGTNPDADCCTWQQQSRAASMEARTIVPDRKKVAENQQGQEQCHGVTDGDGQRHQGRADHSSAPTKSCLGDPNQNDRRRSGGPK